MAVQLDPVLLDVLACPDTHHAPLSVGTPDDPDADALTCTECGRVFEVRDGIPVLLLPDDDQAPEPDAGPVVGDPAAGGPAAGGPAGGESAVDDSGSGDPVAGESTAGDSAAGGPAVGPDAGAPAVISP